jgi:hypothetical protein
MNRLQNAQKLLGNSLAALESAVAQSQLSTSQAGATDDNSHNGSDDGSGGLAATPTMDLGKLSQDVTAIEADLDKAIRMIAELTAQHSAGDGA